MPNPGVFEYAHSTLALWSAGVLIFGFIAALVSGVVSDFPSIRRAAKRTAVAGAALFVVGVIATVFIATDANRDNDVHEQKVSSWLEATHNIHVADSDLEELLDYESVEATVDGEKRYVAVAADDDGNLIVLTESRR
jgi:hypothetical protein